MHLKAFVLTTVATAALVLSPGVSAAQSNLYSAPSPDTVPGWTFTPTLSYAGAWDDNALIQGAGDNLTADYTSVVNSAGDLAYNGKRSRFGAAYDGAFLLYRQLNTLNSYDQHASVSLRHRATSRVTLFVQNSFASVPTTEFAAIVGVPFVRIGSRVEDLSSGMDWAINKRTSVGGSYNLQWVQFDKDPITAKILLGGHSQGGSGSLRHQLSALTALVADYSLQHGNVVSGSPFTIQNATVGAERRLGEFTHIYGSAGISRLALGDPRETRTGPAWRVGLSRDFEHAGVTVSYSRAYVPAFSFGGTQQNEELNGRVRAPITRRAYAVGALAWRRNEPLVTSDLRLRSWWIEAAVGYALAPWARLEGFYGGTRQTIDRPGGQLNRNRVGFQIVTSKPMRIQ